MAEIKRATLDLFDLIYPLIEHFPFSHMDRKRWLRFLEHNVSKRHEYFGYVLTEGKRAVGFLGGLFHERQMEDSVHSFCNLFCWYVLEGYRSQSLMLLLPFLKEHDLTVTSLTPSREACKILRQFQFQVLERDIIVLPVLPAGGASPGFDISSDPKRITDILDQKDLKILHDHGPAWCGHLAVWERKEKKNYCYVVFNKVKKRGLPFTQVYYTGEPEIFRKNLGRIQREFLRVNRTFFTVIDRRLFHGPVSFPCFSYRLRYPRLYRSHKLKSEQIDNLYSELLFFQQI